MQHLQNIYGQKMTHTKLGTVKASQFKWTWPFLAGCEHHSRLQTRPPGLTFTWCGCYGLRHRRKPTEFAHSLKKKKKKSVPVSISVFVALSTVFYSINSPDKCVRFLTSGLISCLLVLSTTCLFMNVSLSPDIIPGGWQSSKHQLTNVQHPHWFRAGMELTFNSTREKKISTFAIDVIFNWCMKQNLRSWPKATVREEEEEEEDDGVKSDEEYK